MKRQNNKEIINSNVYDNEVQCNESIGLSDEVAENYVLSIEKNQFPNL